MENYAQALLEGYVKLMRSIEATDKKVLDIALCSSGYRGVMRETLEDIKSICDLTDLKVKLLKIAATVNDMVKRLPYKFRQAAKFRYLKGQSIEDTAKVMGVSTRTVYRLLNDLPSKCAQYLIDHGVTYEAILKMLEGQNWLVDMANKIAKKAERQSKTLNFNPQEQIVIKMPQAAVI